MPSGSNTKFRFFNIHLWDEPWFVELDHQEKLLWIYINTRCDNIGLYDHSKKKTNFEVEVSIDKSEIPKMFNRVEEKIVEINGKLLIKDFCHLQHCRKSPLLPKAKVILSYMNDMRDSGLVNYFAENQPSVVSDESLLFFKAFENGILEFKSYSNNKKTSINGLTEYERALNTVRQKFGSMPSQSHTNDIPITLLSNQGKGKGKNAGKGGSNELGKKPRIEKDDYNLSKELAEQIVENCDHHLVKEVQGLVTKLRKERNDNDPHETISIMLEKVKEYYPKEQCSVSLIEYEIDKTYEKRLG